MDQNIIKVIKKLQKSPDFFISNFGYVKHPAAGIIPFKLFSYQKRCLNEFLGNRFVIFKKTRQCLSEGTVIYTPTGPRNIEDIKVGDIVYSYNNGKIEESLVTNWINNGYRDCIKVKTETQEIICTGDHEFLIDDKWIRADKIIPLSDSMTVPTIPCGNVPSTAAPVIGWLVSDGCTKIYSKCGKPYFANSNRDYINQFKDDVYAHFGDISLIERKATSGFSNPSDNIRVNIQHSKGLKFVDQYDLQYSKKDRKLPDEVFKWDLKSVGLLLNRLYAGDGWYGKTPTANEIGYATQSRILAWQVVQLLAMFGINLKPRYCNDGLYRIKTCRRDYVLKFIESIGMFGKIPSNKINNTFVRHQPVGLVKKIEPAGQHRVYDITVEGNHNMIANGFVTHNCGISTLTGIFALWFAMFHSNKTILVVSKRDEDAMEFLKRNIRFPYEYLPDWMKHMWPLVKDNDHTIGFPNGSTIRSLTSSPDTLRSHASSMNILDEAAFMPHMDEMWAAGLPSLTHGGSAIVISTTAGIGNWYWQTWTDAESKKNDFKPILVDWWDMDWSITYKDPMSGNEKTIAPCAGLVKLKDPEQIKKYGPYWSPWLEEQYRNLTQRGNDYRFRQEVLATFIGSGNTVLEPDALAFAKSTVDENFQVLSMIDYTNPVNGEKTTLNFQDQLRIWKQPIYDSDPSKSHNYVLGADVATGDAEDYHSLVVLDTNTREQVAELQIRALPRIFAKMIDYIGRLYNNALAVVERNGPGSGVIQELNEDLSYPNLYRDSRENASLQKKYNYYGFSTQKNSKHTLNKALMDYISTDGYTIKSLRLVKELDIYVYLGNNKTGAQPGSGNHDDLVIACGLAFIGVDSTFIGDNHVLAPYSVTGNGLADELAVKITDYMSRGGKNVLLPFATPDIQNKHKDMTQELESFTAKLGGIPISKNILPSMVGKKHYINRRPPTR